MTTINLVVLASLLFELPLCNSRSTFVSVFTIKRPKGLLHCKSQSHVLMLKILNKCILSMLVYNLFLNRQCNISIHQFIGCLHEIEIQIF